MVARRNVAGFLLVATITLAGPLAGAAEITVNVLTGGTSGAPFALGVALGSAIDKAMPGVRSSVQATKTSAENLELLQAGRGEIAFTAGDTLSDAWKGNEDAGFKAPLARIRGIAALHSNYIQIVARADSGIRSLAGLKGKRFSVGALRSATELDARRILAAAGISYKDFAKVEYLPFGESLELMKERQLDATLQSAVLGVSTVRDFAGSVDIVVVPIASDIVGRMNDPAYRRAIVPANTYRGQPASVPTVAVQNYLVTHEGVSADVVYNLTKALWTSLDQLAAAYPAAKEISVKHAFDNMPVPLHPGAERYYREAGLVR